MKRYLLLIAFIASITSVYAQTSLKGKVIAADRKTPLAGASIVFGKGGTSTDKDGNFTIDCSKVGRITVSFVGYDSYSQTIKSCDEELNISLTPSSRTLDEVEFTATSVENKSILY